MLVFKDIMLFCVAGGIVNYKSLEEIHTLRNVVFSYIQQIFSVNHLPWNY